MIAQNRHPQIKSSTTSSHRRRAKNRKGDEIIEWNGRSLHGRSAQEVHDIVTDIRNDSHQVELIVSRPINGGPQQQRKAIQQQAWRNRNAHSPVRYSAARGT